MSDVIDNSKIPSIEKYDNRIRVSNYDLTRCGNERYFDLCEKIPEYPEVTRFTETFSLTERSIVMMGRFSFALDLN